MNITEIARAIAPKAEFDIIGIRPGEKLHEQMISAEDSFSTYEYPDHYKILPALNAWCEDPNRIKDGKKVLEGFVYASDSNPEWMAISALQEWLANNRYNIGEL